VQDAGAFAVVLELVPATLAGELTKELAIPTIGIGAGADCDAQVLVWTDMAGLSVSRAKFVKVYAELAAQLEAAARAFAADVNAGTYPDDAHSYE
ncbi:MAG: 3-methyl-2-oxobutanoate hydroxymethyltransferase, partial [Frankiaceae bacterium]|nr:3-methyl-2-oxobutanoate hydroxymethyltransferase [Frankiaceae bacterium]